MNTLAILRGTFGNFRPQSLTTSANASIFKDTYHYLERTLSPIVNSVMLMNTLAILRGTFGNFRPLSLTTSTCVSLHRDLYHYLERALSPTCEHYNVNEHPRNPSGYFSVTFDHYHWLLRLASRHLPRYRQLVNIVMLMNTLAIFRGYFW